MHGLISSELAIGRRVVRRLEVALNAGQGDIGARESVLEVVESGLSAAQIGLDFVQVGQNGIEVCSDRLNGGGWDGGGRIAIEDTL